MADINARTRLLVGTTAAWAAADLVLGDGELVLERAGSGLKMKAGNGTARYSALPFVTMTPTIPPEYVTQDEGDARYLQLSGIATIKTANAVPRMLASGLLDASMIPLPPAIASSSGAADAGKLVKTAASGKIDPTFITTTTGTYKGTVDATQAKPAGTFIAGDYYINSATGMVHASWGLTAGTAIGPTQQLVYDGALWSIVGAGTGYLPMAGGTLSGPGHLTVGGNLTYNGTLTGSTGIVNLGAGQFIKDVAGNIGLAVTPSAWGANVKGALEGIGGALAFGSLGSSIYHTSNLWNDGTNWIYKTAAPAGMFLQYQQQFQWHQAVSGAAGASATLVQAMTLDAAGNLGLAAVPSAWGSNYRALEMPNAAALVAAVTGGPAMFLAANWTYDGTTEKYKVTAPATRYTQTQGIHQFQSAISAAAGNPITWFDVLKITLGGVIQDGAGNELGWRDIPQDPTVNVAMSAAQRGKAIALTGTTYTIPNNLPAGSTICLMNLNGGSAIALTGFANLHLAGSTLTGNRTLAPWGWATIYVQSQGGTAFIMGNVS